MITKNSVNKLISKLPASSTIDDIIYELYVQKKIERGLQAVKSKKFISQAEVEKKYLAR